MPGGGTSGVSGVRQKTVNGQERIVMDYQSKGGIDTAWLAEAHDKMVEVVKTKYEDKIDESTQKIAALKEVDISVSKILEKLNILRGSYHGSVLENKSIFATHHVSVQNKNPADDKIYLDCSAESKAEERELKISIEQLASKDKTLPIGEAYPEHMKTALNLEGTITANEKDVVISPTMTLEYIYRTLKLAAKGSKFDVFVDVLKSETASAAGSYRLQLRATEEGKPLTLSENEGSNVLAGLNIKPSEKTEEQLSAHMTIDGMKITRSSNKISDAIGGFNFVLMRATTGLDEDYITVSTEKNLVGIRDAVFELADGLKGFYELENKYCPRDAKHQPEEGAVLAGDRSLEKLTKDLSDFMRGVALGGEKDDLKMGSELGFSLKRLDSGVHTFDFDRGKLIKILMSTPEKIERFFALRCESTSPSFDVLQLSSNLSPQIKSASIQLKVWKETEEPHDLRASFKTRSGNWTEATISKTGLISGKEKTIFESLRVLFLGSLEENLEELDSFIETTLTISQGKADELAVRLSESLGGKAIEGVEKEKEKLKEKMEKEVSVIEKKRDDMIKRSEKVHQAAAKYEMTKKLIKAQELLQNSDNW